MPQPQPGCAFQPEPLDNPTKIRETTIPRDNRNRDNEAGQDMPHSQHKIAKYEFSKNTPEFVKTKRRERGEVSLAMFVLSQHDRLGVCPWWRLLLLTHYRYTGAIRPGCNHWLHLFTPYLEVQKRTSQPNGTKRGTSSSSC